MRNSLKSDDAPSVIAWLLWEMMFGDDEKPGPPQVPAKKPAPPPPPPKPAKR